MVIAVPCWVCAIDNELIARFLLAKSGEKTIAMSAFWSRIAFSASLGVATTFCQCEVFRGCEAVSYLLSGIVGIAHYDNNAYVSHIMVTAKPKRSIITMGIPNSINTCVCREEYAWFP